MKTTIIQNNKVKTIAGCKALAFTGHTNIEKAYNINYNPLVYDKNAFDMHYNRIKNYILSYIKKHNQKIIIIQGMARGVDEIAGLVAIDLELDMICAVPHSVDWHKNREVKDKKLQAIFYDKLLSYKKSHIFEIKKSYSTGHQFANFARNCFMVDIATDIVSVKDYDSSGTDHCINYAKTQGKYLGNIGKEIEKW